MSNNELHRLSIDNGRHIKLDEFELNGVVDYQLSKNFEESVYAVLKLTLFVSDEKVNTFKPSVEKLYEFDDVNRKMKFCDLLRKRREEYGMTKRELARAINRSASFICDMEYGKKEPSLETLLEIRKVLKIDLNLIG